MMTAQGRRSGIVVAAIGLLLGFSVAVPAADLATRAGAPASSYRMWLACENGRDYPLQPAAVTDDGDIVTGYLTTGRGHRVHVRLIPMGDGYRYAGPAVWFDGFQEEAILANAGTRSAIECTVMQQK